MRIAIIDLGTNSVRFDVHQLGPNRSVRLLHREKIMIRLGQGVFLHGRLDRSAVQRTLHAFHRFKKTATRYHASKIIAFGTSALREVSDRDRFLAILLEKTGIQVRVISGDEEAQPIALGVLSHEKAGKGRFALVDIGGGSTEISICRGKKVLRSRSFPLGTARLQQLFLKRSPPSDEAVEELRRHIRGTLSEVMLAERWPGVARVIGSSGTIKALARLLEGSEREPFNRDKLKTLVARMSRMTTTELLGLSGMEAKRVDMILAGAVLFEECMDALGARKASSTEYSLRDGILEEELAIHQMGGGTHLALHLPDLIQKAMVFGGDGDHLRRMVKVAEDLFDRLQRVHRLKPAWKTYLSAAVILRDTGEAVRLSDHPSHSYYIIKNADFPGAEEWEVELIAQLCRHHEGAKPVPKDEGPPAGDKRISKDVFAKLLAMLRVVDAIDAGPESVVRIRDVKLTRSRVEIRYGGRGLTELEALALERKAPYFKKALGKDLVTATGTRHSGRRT